MALQVATTKAATAVVFVLDIQHDLSTGRLRSPIKRVTERLTDERLDADFVVVGFVFVGRGRAGFARARSGQWQAVLVPMCSSQAPSNRVVNF
jgi:hypothetical protein